MSNSFHNTQSPSPPWPKDHPEKGHEIGFISAPDTPANIPDNPGNETNVPATTVDECPPLPALDSHIIDDLPQTQEWNAATDVAINTIVPVTWRSKREEE